MRFPISTPLVVRNVKIIGPKGLVKVDMILDTGAASTALSWSVLFLGKLQKKSGGIKLLFIRFATSG